MRKISSFLSLISALLVVQGCGTTTLGTGERRILTRADDKIEVMFFFSNGSDWGANTGDPMLRVKNVGHNPISIHHTGIIYIDAGGSVVGSSSGTISGQETQYDIAPGEGEVIRLALAEHIVSLNVDRIEVKTMNKEFTFTWALAK